MDEEQIKQRLSFDLVFVSPNECKTVKTRRDCNQSVYIRCRTLGQLKNSNIADTWIKSNGITASGFSQWALRGCMSGLLQTGRNLSKSNKTTETLNVFNIQLPQSGVQILLELCDVTRLDSSLWLNYGLYTKRPSIEKTSHFILCFAIVFPTFQNTW